MTEAEYMRVRAIAEVVRIEAELRELDTYLRSDDPAQMAFAPHIVESLRHMGDLRRLLFAQIDTAKTCAAPDSMQCETTCCPNHD